MASISQGTGPVASSGTRRAVAGLAILGMAILAAAVFNASYTIDQGERGVVLRFGEAQALAEPGLHFKIPFVDQVHTISVRNEKITFDRVPTYSKDQQTAELRISVNYRILDSEAIRVYSDYRTAQGYADRVITPRVLEESKTVFGRFNAMTAIQERGRLNAEIFDAIARAVQGTGGTIEAVQLENIDFSDIYEASIEARMQAEVEVAKLQQQLEQDKVRAEQIRVTAQGQADARRAQAQAEADAIRLRGEAEAASINARGDALRRNPELVRLILAERWNGILPTTMVPGSTVPFIDLTDAVKGVK